MVIFNEYHIICLEAARRRGFGGLNEYKSLSRGRHDVKKVVFLIGTYIP